MLLDTTYGSWYIRRAGHDREFMQRGHAAPETRENEAAGLLAASSANIARAVSFASGRPSCSNSDSGVSKEGALSLPAPPRDTMRSVGWLPAQSSGRLNSAEVSDEGTWCPAVQCVGTAHKQGMLILCKMVYVHT